MATSRPVTEVRESNYTRSDDRHVRRDKLLPSTPATSNNGAKLHEVQLQVDEISSIMRQNVEKIMDRGTKLEHLHEKSERLKGSADIFQKVSSRVHKAMWWNNMKLRVIVGALISIVVLALIIWLSITFSKKNK